MKFKKKALEKASEICLDFPLRIVFLKYQKLLFWINFSIESMILSDILTKFRIKFQKFFYAQFKCTFIRCLGVLVIAKGNFDA